MSSHETISVVAQALSLYLREIEEQRALCSKHLQTTAIHQKGKELQVYRQFDRSEDTATSIRRFGEMLPSWESMSGWNDAEKVLLKLEREVLARMQKHTKQNPCELRQQEGVFGFPLHEGFAVSIEKKRNTIKQPWNVTLKMSALE